MHPQKVVREQVKVLTDLPNIGKAMAKDLNVIGICVPQQLVGRNPFELYQLLCDKTQADHDPCVIDVFMSVIDFMDGGPARSWWEFTPRRKQITAGRD